MVVVPVDKALTKPVEFTVATSPLDEVHGFEAAGEADPESCAVAFTHAERVPVIVGKALTVNVAVC